MIELTGLCWDWVARQAGRADEADRGVKKEDEEDEGSWRELF